MRTVAPTFLASLLTLAAVGAQAQTTLDQNKALAGGAIPGDAPGFPVTISQPGSYKLTGNLTVPANTTAIDITVPGVTLDLNGFSIMGPMKCVMGGVGKTMCTSVQNNFGTPLVQAVDGSILRNGVVQGSTGMGIKLIGMGHLVEGVTIMSTAGAAILRTDMGAAPTTLKSVRIMGSMFDGVQGQYLQIEDSLIHGVNHVAVHTGGAYVNFISNSMVSDVGNFALGSVLTRNTAYMNVVNGVGGKSLGGNTADGNPF